MCYFIHFLRLNDEIGGYISLWDPVKRDPGTVTDTASAAPLPNQSLYLTAKDRGAVRCERKHNLDATRLDQDV